MKSSNAKPAEGENDNSLTANPTTQVACRLCHTARLDALRHHVAHKKSTLSLGCVPHQLLKSWLTAPLFRFLLKSGGITTERMLAGFSFLQ